ncbi:MAG: FAD-dependent oxidoreductase [Acidobacteriota bacterium]|nr:FAD-dependent oxidoreductase [Acidobacteriota bacterium]
MLSKPSLAVRLVLVLALALLGAGAWAAPAGDLDLCVYGGNSAGVAAAVQMARMGGSVLVLEPGRHLGGLTAGGLGATDIGNSAVIGGISREFYDAVIEHYRSTYGEDSPQLEACFGGFRFEPHVAEAIYEAMLAKEGIPVWREARLASARVRDGRIVEIVLEDGSRVRARVFIDATYEGDLMAAAGVSFTVGREPIHQYGEQYNGIQTGQSTHQFTIPTSAYRYRDVPESGLLWGISSEGPGELGEGDNKLQAYNLRMCLTSDPDNLVPYEAPPGYDRSRYLLLARWLHLRGPEREEWRQMPYHSIPMPNGKTDTNNNGPFSTDFIGSNYEWPEASYAERQAIYERHLHYQQGLMYFLANDPAVPLALRREAARWGLAADEFTDSGHWSHQIYVREGRRMIADYVMTDHDCLGTVAVDDPVGMGAYNMDSHNVQRYVDDRGLVKNEGDVQVRLPGPYPISYRSIRPKESECTNLLVPVAVSASHIAYGSIRMEPVFMILGQSAATAAYMAIEGGVPVQRVDYDALRARLDADGQVLSYTPPAGQVRWIDPSEFIPGVAMDDTGGVTKGSWSVSASANWRAIGSGYLHDNDARNGKCSITYSPDIPFAGRYEIFISAPRHTNRATNVPVTVTVDRVEQPTVRVSQRGEVDADPFVSVGVFDLPEGSRVVITVGNEGTDGYVVADGVYLVPEEE